MSFIFISRKKQIRGSIPQEDTVADFILIFIHFIHRT